VGASSPTIADVARLAGVSRATVSRVMNNSARVRAPLRKRVKRAISQLRYYPSHGAVTLSRRQSRTLGLVAPDIPAQLFSSHFTFAQVVQGVASTARDNDYSVLLHTCKPGSSYLLPWRRQQVDGIVLTLLKTTDPSVAEVVEAKCPAVLVGGHDMDRLLPRVYADMFGAAVTTVEYLASLGHRRVGYAGGWADYSSGQQRLAGFREGLGRCGLPFSSDLVSIFEGEDVSPEITTSILNGFMKASVTAIVAINDFLALALIREAQEMGFLVPEDLSIVGMDDIEAAQLVRPALTTFRMPGSRLGERAGQLVIDLIERRESPAPPPSCCLSLEMIVRESCAPPSKGRSKAVVLPHALEGNGHGHRKPALASRQQ